MKSRNSAFALASLAILLACSSAIAADSRPNVILIMADDIGYECFGCYGSRQYQTPHIDQMAERGLRFTHCYSQPLCTPSRIKIMTGLSNVRNYSAFSVLNSDQRTIGQFFHEGGYETAIAGKWQLLGAEHYSEQFRFKGTWPDQAGFDHACLWQVDKLGSRYWQPLLHIDGKNRQFEDEAVYGPEVVNRYVLDFLDAKHDRPFFLYYPMILVHNPFEVTPDSAEKKSKNKQRNFEDMVAFMDKMVGRVVAKTEELGIADNTLIFFTGDNGTNTKIKSQLGGVEIVGGKGKTTDGGTHVPLVALWKGVTPVGRVCEDLVDFSDFLPTCLEAAELAAPCGLDGQSFLPQLRGEPGTPRQWMHCYYCPRPERTEPKRFVRDKRWKLYGDGRFFDVACDVLEKKPLGDEDLNVEARAAKAKLQKALQSMPPEGENLLKFVPNKK